LEDRPDELVGSDALDQNAGGTSVAGGLGDGSVGVASQDQDRRVHAGGAQPPGGLDAVEPRRHADVHEDHVRLDEQGRRDSLVTAGGLGDHLDAGLGEQVTEQAAQRGVVVDQQDSRPRSWWDVDVGWRAGRYR
jgi:hypothetical protein